MQQINEAVELADGSKDATPHFINRNAQGRAANTNVGDFTN